MARSRDCSFLGGEGRNFHYPKTSSVSPRVVFSWQRWQRILEREGTGACFSVIENHGCCLVDEGKERVLSLSLFLDFVCYLLSEPLLTACLSSKESEFILVLPRFCSRFYSPGFFLPFFRLSFLRRNLEMRLLRNLERWKQLDSGGFCEKCLYFLWKFIEFTCFFIRERNLFNCFICFFI